MNSSSHTWSFSTVGGVKRVNLESGNDLLHLDELDQKLWTALSCPVKGLEIDHKTLELIDTDNDGQIRVPEVLIAVKWICNMLNNPNDLLKQENELPLSAINTSSEDGKKLLASAKIILKNLGKEGAQSVSVNQTSNITEIFAKTSFNGDGIIGTDSLSDAALLQAMNEIMRCVGSVTDRNGTAGISLELLNVFFENCSAFIQWHKKAEAAPAIIHPLGENTQSAYAAYLAVKPKIDDYYLRCRLAAFDPDATSALNQLVKRIETISQKELPDCIEEIATYPLAKIEANKPLPLQTAINPAWEAAMNAFYQHVIVQLCPGNNTLSEQEWKTISEKFAAFATWKNEEEGKLVEQLGIERVKELVNSDTRKLLQTLIEQDLAVENEANSIILVDKLVRFYRDLFRLLNNFVTFYDFYSPGSNAIFLAGTLYIDQRSCDLCIKVNDMNKHNTMVGLSGMYLLYCECVARAGQQKMIIVTALTNGDIDNLVVGRNAVFYDKSGLDWDATIIKIVENPISIRQAFFSPYRKVARFIETQVEKFASEKEKESNDKATTSITEASASQTAPAPSQPKSPPFDIGKFVGIFAAIGLAFGAIGGVLASFISGFLGLVWWKMPIACVGIILVISGPSMMIAWLKLRKRNLAPILDANGWAINARAIVNIPFGITLTQLAGLPLGSTINLNDPFTKKKRPLFGIVFLVLMIAAIVVFILWKTGVLNLN